MLGPLDGNDVNGPSLVRAAGLRRSHDGRGGTGHGVSENRTDCCCPGVLLAAGHQSELAEEGRACVEQTKQDWTRPVMVPATPSEDQFCEIIKYFDFFKGKK